MPITVSVNKNFRNKELVPGATKSAWSTGYTTETLRPIDLYRLVTQGVAWAPAVFSGGRARKNFISAQLIGLDFDQGPDVETLRRDPFIERYGLFLYPTPTSTPDAPRTRVVFMLSERVDCPTRYEALVRGLLRQFDAYQPDDACKDAARGFYGSTRRGSYYIGNILPIEIAGGLCADEAKLDDERWQAARRRAAITPAPSAGLPIAHLLRGARAARYANNALERILEEAMRVPAGQGLRHVAFIRAAAAIASLRALPGVEAETLIRTLGASMEREPAEIEGALRWVDERVETYVPDLAPRLDIAAVEVPPINADQVVDMRWISELDIDLTIAGIGGLGPRSALMIKSALGTGKTELIKRALAALEAREGRPITALLISHRRTLGRAIARRLNFVWHRDQLPGGVSARQSPHLAITVDSLWRVAGRHYDVVIIDEATQVLAHLLTSDTLRGARAMRAYGALREQVLRAGFVLAMDAGLDDVTIEWLRDWGRDGWVIHNTHQPQQGQTLTLYPDRWSALALARELIDKNAGPVLIPTSSRRESAVIHEQLSEKYGASSGRLINADTSQAADTIEFLERINDELPTLRWLVCSPSLGTGVSIDCPVEGVVGFFDRQPLSPADMLQMMGRARNARVRAAYVQQGEGVRPTDPRLLYERRLTGAYYNAALGGYDHGIDAMLLDAHWLGARLEAATNAERNDPLSWFAARARAEGYQIEIDERDGGALKAGWLETRQQLLEAYRELVLTVPPVDPDTYEQAQLAGAVTPELRAGYERWLIERAAGRPIDEETYEALNTPKKREALRNWADANDNEQNVRARDQAEAQNRWQINKRRNRVARRQFFHEFCRVVFNCTPAELADVVRDMSADELRERGSVVVQRYRQQLIWLLGWVPGACSANPIPVVRWVLRRFGVALASRVGPRDAAGKRPMVYWIEETRWAFWMALARSRLAARVEENANNNILAFSSTAAFTVDPALLAMLKRDWEEGLLGADPPPDAGLEPA